MKPSAAKSAQLCSARGATFSGKYGAIMSLKRSFLLVIGCVVIGGCAGTESISIPSATSISVIRVCDGKQGCNLGKFEITDAVSINQVIDAASMHKIGWQTEGQMALTTGWLTYPTPSASAGFYNLQGQHLLVLWFGEGWIGAAMDIDGRRVRYFRKTDQAGSKQLRDALRITDHTSATAELSR